MIQPATYQARRKTFMNHFNDGDIIFLRGSGVIERNRDVVYPFRQDSDFKYVTGADRPNLSAALVPADQKFILFAQKPSALGCF